MRGQPPDPRHPGCDRAGAELAAGMPEDGARLFVAGSRRGGPVGRRVAWVLPFRRRIAGSVAERGLGGGRRPGVASTRLVLRREAAGWHASLCGVLCGLWVAGVRRVLAAAGLSAMP